MSEAEFQHQQRLKEQFRLMSEGVKRQRLAQLATHVPAWPRIETAPPKIHLKVKDCEGKMKQFKIHKYTRLGRLLGIYCVRMALAASELRFVFDDGSVDGQPRCVIRPDDTAETVSLEDADITAVLDRIE